MTCSTLMVHLELGRPNTGLLQVTAELAERFHAGVIGIAARQPMQMVYGDGYVAGDLFVQDREEIAREIDAAEAEFRAALSERAAFVEWRSTRTYSDLAAYLASEARSADLVVTGTATGDFLDASRAVNTGELVMRAGRPVLIVPTGATTLQLDHVLIGWKETREARRAVADALPLLGLAARVSVVEIAADADLDDARRHAREVVAWLKRHEVAAEGSAQRSTGDDATALYALCQDQGADVIVAGAYGHSRLREWAFGGVTRDLLLTGTRCAFVSH